MFKSVKDYPDLYEVSELGDVLSTGMGESNNSRSKKLSPFRTGNKTNQYLKVRLYSDGKFQDMLVHRLVAEAFIPNPDNLPQVNHKDENTFNNHVSNLEWCTAQYNKEYSAAKSYTFISPSGESVTVFNLSKFCRENQISNGSMYHLISGRYQQCKGWTLPS